MDALDVQLCPLKMDAGVTAVYLGNPALCGTELLSLSGLSRQGKGTQNQKGGLLWVWAWS